MVGGEYRSRMPALAAGIPTPAPAGGASGPVRSMQIWEAIPTRACHNTQ